MAVQTGAREEGVAFVLDGGPESIYIRTESMLFEIGG